MTATGWGQSGLERLRAGELGRPGPVGWDGGGREGCRRRRFCRVMAWL